MFNPVQIKYEYTEVENVDSASNVSNNSKYPALINENIDYKYNEVPQYWYHQLSNQICSKNEIYDQHNSYHSEENNSLTYMRNCIESSTQHSGNREENLNPINQQRQTDVTQNQSQFSRSVQSTKFTNHMVIPGPVSPIKSNRPGRPSKDCSESNVAKKVKCQCEVCFKEFGHKSNLFIHMRTHNGERPYKCNQCEKCFTHSGNLAIHMRTHSGERPYGCQICGKTFSHSGNLSTHLRTHSGVKPYKCVVCGKEFRHSGNLSIHVRIHSGVKPFQCKVCGKDFYHSGNLTTHMKKHSVNINSSTNQSESNEQVISTRVNLNETTRLSSSNNLSLSQTTDIKLMPNVSNIVPIKNESNEKKLITTVETVTSVST